MFGKLKIYIIFVIFLLLPLFSTSTNVRKRRRPSIDLVDPIDSGLDQQTAIPDQIAIAAESNYQNAIQYEPEYSPKHNYRHGKLMIKYMNSAEEQQQEKQKYQPSAESTAPQSSDIIHFSDTETAQEYVQKALEKYNSQILETNSDLNIMSTSPRYDIFPSNSDQIIDDEKLLSNQNYDQVTRSYDVYDINNDDNNYGKSSNYPSHSYSQYTLDSTKLPQQNMKFYSESSINALPLTGSIPSSSQRGSSSSQRGSSSSSQRGSSSANAQIPKEEIRKHIEQAVAKYMKEMEADGKIIKSSSTQKQKVYYKYPLSSSSSSSEQLMEMNKPFVSTTTSRTHNLYGTQQQVTSPSSVKMMKHSSSPLQSSSSSSSSLQNYQPGKPLQDTIENLNQNVEFVYKMKTRQQPILKQTKLPSKISSSSLSSNFDHSHAIKNFQGFDMSHMTIQDEQQKPQKLLFTSEVYRDINLLPYKPEKTMIKDSNIDYHGYGLEQGVSQSLSSNKYIPLSEHLKNTGQITSVGSSSSSNNNNEQLSTSINDGYPIMNPYQYILNKEQKYSETSLNGNSGDSTSWTPSHIPSSDKDNNNNKINSHHSISTSLKGLDYDSYSPKFNNNPEGYGYQHNYNYKTIDPHHYHTTTKHPNRYFKRGKRGGSNNNNNNGNNNNNNGSNNNYKKKITNNRGIVNKDIEANIALRPPPKVM